MRTYEYTENYAKLLTPEIVALLSQIHEYKGAKTLFIQTQGDALNHLAEAAKIQSTSAEEPGCVPVCWTVRTRISFISLIFVETSSSSV